jgi:putative two-component system response regulator
MTTHGGEKGQRAKVLVVDDETLVRTMMCDALQAIGYAPVAASSGEEALRTVRMERPACVLLDIMMPDLDGYDTCAALKADADTASMPVLLVSATTDARVMEQAEKVGATTVLRKPVRMDELQRAIVRALGASA